MKREIIFRGKTKSGKWIYGMPTFEMDYIFNEDNIDSVDNYEVYSETVCQFTGHTDKNGKKIFEGDTVIHRFKRIWQTDFHTSKVVWNHKFCCYYLNDGTCNHRMRDDIEYEIIEV